MLVTTTINHIARRALQLSISDYCFMDMVCKLSTNPKSKKTGWCTMSKQTMADETGMTKRGVYKLIARLIQEDLLERDTKGNIRHTSKWYDTVIWADQEKEKYFAGIPRKVVNSVHPGSELSSPQLVNSVHPASELSSPNTINNTNKDIERDTAHENSFGYAPPIDPAYSDLHQSVIAQGIFPEDRPRLARMLQTHSEELNLSLNRIPQKEQPDALARFISDPKHNSLISGPDLRRRFRNYAGSWARNNNNAWTGVGTRHGAPVSTSARLKRY